MIFPRNKAIGSLRLDARSTIEGYEFIRRNSMAKQTDNDMIPRLALGLAIFVAMRFAPKVIAWWNKRKEKTI
jgi:hypothetical protein